MKRILITGATDGIGLETAKVLASKGHQIILHGRDKVKLQHAEKTVENISPDAVISTYIADLSSLTSTKHFAEIVLEEQDYLDVIINNAGVFKALKSRTEEGFDIRFVVNTFAPFIVTKVLLPLLSKGGRIINLSSAAQASIDFDAMKGKRDIEEDFQAYAQSKLALTIWSNQIASSLTSEQISVAVNPGSLLASKMVKEGFGVEGNSLSIGADILVDAALGDKFKKSSGLYFDNDAKSFCSPHPDAGNTEISASLMKELNKIYERLGE